MEDIKLNTVMFHWPSQICTVLDHSQGRIMLKRDQIEEELKKRVAAFEEKLEAYTKEVESFKKKEVNKWLQSGVCIVKMACHSLE